MDAEQNDDDERYGPAEGNVSDEGEYDDDEEGPSRNQAFEIMTPTQFNAHRLDAWEMAHSKLSQCKWGEYEVDPSDVLILARFLEGDELE